MYYEAKERHLWYPPTFQSSASACFITTPERKIEGRVLCSAPKGTGTILSNCDPDYRCLHKISKDGRDVQVQSLTGLVQVAGKYGCVRAVEEMSEGSHPCKQDEWARCVLWGETVNV